MYLRQSYPASKPNNSFKPNLLRYSKSVAEKACHAFASTTQVGLTQALGSRSIEALKDKSKAPPHAKCPRLLRFIHDAGKDLRRELVGPRPIRGLAVLALGFDAYLCFSLGAGLLAFVLAPVLQRHVAALLFGLASGLIAAAVHITSAA